MKATAPRYRSTAGRSPVVDLATALFAGPAPDGGLYLPVSLDRVPPVELAGCRTIAETALPIARRLFGDEAGELEGLLREALDFPVPLREVEPGRFVLELFWGPTLAFKDVGARVMARLLQRSLGAATRSGSGREAKTSPTEPVHVLVATSGDTGSAVAHAFFGVEPFEVVVLYPRGKISQAQRKLFTTLGGNVRSLAVEGTFDDCQSMVKKAFADRDLRSRQRLASANSINVGRFLPQTFYYFHLRAQLPAAYRDQPLVVSVPSGNFGNLTAGVVAHLMGLEVDRLIASTNVNDVVPEYLDTGLFEPRPSQTTLSNAMDVGNPSNFARLLALFDGDRKKMLERLEGYAFDDRQTEKAIREVRARAGVLLDPHTAVGWLGLDRALESARKRGLADPVGVVLGTAHPAKFAEVVERATGEPVELPPVLRDCLDRNESITEIAADYQELRAILDRDRSR